MNEPLLPNDFFWRRLHSLMGLWLVLFLMEHLFTNSQAALWVGDDGIGFVRAVNGIKNLPYLPLIEFFLLGVPFFIHMAWGIQYLRSSRPNSHPSDGKTPSLPEYPRNKAYTWQRITSWILLFGVIAHVANMRFLNYPEHHKEGRDDTYYVKVVADPGLQTLSERLDFTIPSPATLPEKVKHSFGALTDGETVAAAKDFGTAELLLVRDTFKSPWMILLYTLFVLAAVYHAFNGLWTFLITWGINLTARAQMLTRRFAVSLMILIGFLGLASVWGTYWINLTG